MATGGYINFVSCLAKDDQGQSSQGVLSGEVEGARQVLHSSAAGVTTQLAALEDSFRIFFLIEGSGSFASGDSTHDFQGLSVYIPNFKSAVSISATSPIQMLEIQWLMHDADSETLASAKDSLPYFLAYASARTYKEAIKSPKTTSRTLVPTGVVPRFAAGSVQTMGPDAVGEHAHPMLEQFFLGLPGSNCTVSADGHTAHLGEWTLLHIPLGSMHGVTVEEGSELHYIWIDLFREKKGEAWISDMHKEDE